MHQQHDGRITRPFVNVGDAQAADFGVVRCVGKVRQAGEARFRGAQRLGHNR